MSDRFRIRHKMLSEPKSEEATVMLFGEVVPSGWRWSEDDRSAADFNREIQKARKDGAKALHIRINSPGGDVLEAAAMRSSIVQAGFESVRITVDGVCASAATMIACLPGAQVGMARCSEYMIHNPWTISCGTARDLEHDAERLRNTEQEIMALYAERTGLDEDEIKCMMDDETWLTAPKAVEKGFADFVIEEEREENPIAACARVTTHMMEVMRDMYKNVPNTITVSGAEKATEYTKHEEETNMTMEELMAQNPELVREISAKAIADERQRLTDIDALTIQGYEDMAQTAKDSGMSAMEFTLQIVACQKQKGKDYLAQRKQETANCEKLTGGDTQPRSEEDELNQFQNSLKALIGNRTQNATGMF